MKRVLLLLLLLMGVVSANCFAQGSEPSLNVNVDKLDFGEVPYGESVTKYVRVSGADLETLIQVSISGETDVFSFDFATGWDDLTGGVILVTFAPTPTPTMPPFAYNATLTISSEVKETVTIELIGAVADNFYFDLGFSGMTDPYVFSTNSTIYFYGQVMTTAGPAGANAANVDVEIDIFVNGTKRVITTTTDDSGTISASFEPIPYESGHYRVNCGRVGNNSTTGDLEFDILGISVKDAGNIRFNMKWNEQKTDTLWIQNKSALYGLNGIQMALDATTGYSDWCTISAETISLDTMEVGYIVYTVTADYPVEGDYYYPIPVVLTSDEGAQASFTLWYYCPYEPEDPIWMTPEYVNVTVPIGKSKVVDVMLVNKTESYFSDIIMNFEDAAEELGASIVGNDTIPLIAPHDTIFVSLRFNPDANATLEPYYYTDVHFGNGDIDQYLYVDVTVVSDTVGSFSIDVTDDFTYPQVKAEDPHVASAEVTVTAYHSLEVMSHGYTNDEGLYQIDNLPPGYYWVQVTTDDHHADYNSIIYVSEGENNSEVFLQYLPVDYSWNATPSESGDGYTYGLSIGYTPDVPVPVITIKQSGIHELAYGHKDNFKIIVSNHGAREAHNIQLTFSESSEYSFIPLYDNISYVEADGTVEIPGIYYRSATPASLTDADCDVHVSAISYYYTSGIDIGETSVQNRSLPFDLGVPPVCEPEANNYIFGYPNVNNTYGDPFSSLNNSDEEDGGTPVIREGFGNPCMESLSVVLDGCLPSSIPQEGLLTALSGATAAIPGEGAYNTAQLLLTQLAAFCQDALAEDNGGLWEVKDCLLSAYSELDGCVTRTDANSFQNTVNALYNSTFYGYNDFAFVKSVFSNDVWNDEINVVGFVNVFSSLINSSTGLVSDADAESLASSFVGSAVTHDDILAFAERWNRSIDYWASGYFVVDGSHTDFIQIDDDLISNMLTIQNQYVSAGYNDMDEVYEESIVNGNAIVGDGVSNTSSVKKNFAQKCAMTGEALEETFTIHNGHGSVPMNAIGLEFVVKDENGVDCTDLFEISTLSLKQLTGIDGTGSIEASKDGTAKIQFVPSKQAAMTESKVYYFGGTFTFTDPYTSSTVVHDLYPVAITVKPGPDLYVDYFVPRHILGDDPLTTDTYEPCETARFGVRMQNKGVVTAKNVTLETAKPVIVDQDGVDLDFYMEDVMFNGEYVSLGLSDIPFGNLSSEQASVGVWNFSTEKLANIESYDSHVIHNGSSGLPDLSLVSHKAIHELVHLVYVDGVAEDGINDFLVNDVPDDDDMPDSLYFSQGGRTAVKPVQSISYDDVIGPITDYYEMIDVTLTIHPSSAGWNYGVIDDPGYDKFKLYGCRRDFDDHYISPSNFWQTYVTHHEGEDPVYERKLHILDSLPDNSQDYTYTLTYYLDYDLLKVVDIMGYPLNPSAVPVESIKVYFSDPIVDSTFTYEDMTLTLDGGPNLMDSSVEITKHNELDHYYYLVKIPSLTNESGEYVFTVSTLHVKDTCGYEGYRENQVTWAQALPDYTQTNDLAAGWNWWSPVVNMSSEADFNKLKTALGSDASMIKSRTNGFVSYYEGDWYGTLSLLNNSEMYMINMNSSEAVSIVGPKATLSGKAITLNPGWNWIGYPASGSQSVSLAMANLSPAENDMLKTRNQVATYTASDGWVGTLSTLNPGEGYMYNYHGSGTVDFVYPTPGKDDSQPEKVNGSNRWELSTGSYDLNATIIGVIEIEGQEQREETLTVGAFIGNQCVGQADMLYVESRDRYFVFLNYFGAPNDEISFRLYDESNGMEYSVSETTLLFEANAVSGTLEVPMPIRFNTLVVPEFHVRNLNLFPNPVKSNEKVKVSLREGLADGMEVEVLSSLGVLLYKTTVNDDMLELTTPLTKGVYLIKITGNEGVAYYGKLFVE